MSRTFLFDIGNVLLHFDFGKAARRLAALGDAGAGEVLARLSPFKDALESGQISDEDFITRSIALIGYRGSREQFAETWGDIFAENPPMAPLVHRLARDHRMILFSNTSGLHKDWFMRRFGVFSHFEGGVFSHEVHCMKPGVAFYQEAVTQFGIDPAETFYIDDLAENIAAGQRFGLVCHHYDSARHESLEAEVERWLA
jgi:putative hydrolase of the HAD superfamily